MLPTHTLLAQILSVALSVFRLTVCTIFSKQYVRFNVHKPKLISSPKRFRCIAIKEYGQSNPPWGAWLGSIREGLPGHMIEHELSLSYSPHWCLVAQAKTLVSVCVFWDPLHVFTSKCSAETYKYYASIMSIFKSTRITDTMAQSLIFSYWGGKKLLIAC